MRLFCAVILTSSIALLSGCAGVPVATTNTNSTRSPQGASIQGKVHGGQVALIGAHVYLYAATAGGYGAPSKSLLTSATGNPADGSGNYYVKTGSDGSFGITSDYTCPSTASQLYLYSVGGDPGGGANSAIGLLAALGTCPPNGTLSSSLYIVINEVSTIATAYSIAGYATDALDVSSSGTALATTGIANAFATATNLETLSTGVALAATPTVNGGHGTVPQSEIDTLANILAACVNSTGAVTGGASPTPCYTLFTNALSSGTAGTQPSETATAAINIAHNPGVNIASLYGLQTGAGTPFQPALSVAPNDFTIAVSYNGGGMNDPIDIAIDAAGNVWVTNYDGKSISEFSPTGAALSPANTGFTGGGLNLPTGVAIDAAGNVWAANVSGSGNYGISEFNSSGTAISGSTGDTAGGLYEPYFIAFDASGNIWVTNANANNSISEVNSSGMAIAGSQSPFTGGGLNQPQYIAIDVSGNIWTANNGYNSISELNSSGSPISGSSGYAGGGIDLPQGIAIDASGNVWAANFNGNSISEFTPSDSGGSWNSKSPFTGCGLMYPIGIAIDGSGHIWVTNGSNSGVCEFSSTGSAISGSNGYEGGGQSGPEFNAVDGSGNLWLAGFLSNTVVEFVGVASPVVTPVAANLRAPYGASAVNKP